jgi:hypothetical protein
MWTDLLTYIAPVMRAGNLDARGTCEGNKQTLQLTANLTSRGGTAPGEGTPGRGGGWGGERTTSGLHKGCQCVLGAPRD